MYEFFQKIASPAARFPATFSVGFTLAYVFGATGYLFSSKPNQEKERQNVKTNEGSYDAAKKAGCEATPPALAKPK